MTNCPYCGSTKGFFMNEVVRRSLMFRFDGTPDGATEDVAIDKLSGKSYYCRECFHRLRIEKATQEVKENEIG